MPRRSGELTRQATDELEELEDRLARIEAACLLRSEIDVPGCCQIWNKDPWGNCQWLEYDPEDLTNPPQIGSAPDFRPNEPGPITLPIVEA